MRLTWTQNDGRGRAALALEAPLTSALPLDRLLLDAHPAVLSYDRVAVAGALVFGPWLSGAVELPGAVSPHVAEALDTYCATGRVRTWPATVNADSHFTTGRRLLAVADARRPQVPAAPQTNAEALLHLRRSDRGSGSLIGLDQVVVAGNAYLLASTGEQRAPLPVVTLAVATLFAEDLGAAAVALAGDHSTTPDELAGVEALLASVDLALSHDSTPAPRQD